VPITEVFALFVIYVALFYCITHRTRSRVMLEYLVFVKTKKFFAQSQCCSFLFYYKRLYYT